MKEELQLQSRGKIAFFPQHFVEREEELHKSSGGEMVSSASDVVNVMHSPCRVISYQRDKVMVLLSQWACKVSCREHRSKQLRTCSAPWFALWRRESAVSPVDVAWLRDQKIWPGFWTETRWSVWTNCLSTTISNTVNISISLWMERNINMAKNVFKNI